MASFISSNDVKIDSFTTLFILGALVQVWRKGWQQIKLMTQLKFGKYLLMLLIHAEFSNLVFLDMDVREGCFLEWCKNEQNLNQKT